MNSLMPLAGARPTSTKCSKLAASTLSTTFQRHQSSYRRNRIYSNIKPDENFLPSKTEPHDHIIYNPPPSMPNVHHTPTMFLPENDPRRLLQTPQVKSLLANTPAFTPSGKQRLPPPVRKPYEKRYHLTAENLEEMRKLRVEDPVAWSVKKLAKKFDCSQVFVQNAVAGLAKNKNAIQEKVLEVVKSRWGTKRRIAREDRELRRTLWYRDA